MTGGVALIPLPQSCRGMDEVRVRLQMSIRTEML